MGQPCKRGTRFRVCADCGKSEEVRQDNAGLRCRSCASKAAARANMAAGAYFRLRPPVNGRGSRWHVIRKEAIRAAPFCAWCGTCHSESLQVHHIVPYRLTRDNRHSNLIPLRRRCHKVVELLTVEVEALGLSPESIARVAGLQLRARQAMTGSILSHVAHAA